MLGEIIGIGKSAIGMAKSSPVTLLLVLGIITAVIGFVEYRLHQEYEKGVADTLVKVNEANEKDRQKQAKIDAQALINLNNKLKEATNEADKQRQEAIRLQELLDKPKEVTPGEIITITSKPNCSAMCDDNFQLWKRTTKKPGHIERRN